MNNKPKIAVIGLKGLPAFGGAASVGESIINELVNDYDFTVFSISSHVSKSLKSEEKFRQIVLNKVASGGINTLFYYLQCLFYCLFIKRFDLIYLHHAESGFITPFLRLKYKVIVTFHGIYQENDPKFSSLQNKFFRWSEKQNVKWANTVVSVSKNDTLYVRKKYGREILYIPNGVELFDIPKDLKSDTFILFAAGRVYKLKGLHLLLQALHNINYKGKLKIAGDLSHVKSYTDEIYQMAKGLNVEFLGLVKEKSALMQLITNSALFIFPSLNEAMSMMLLEAASQKTPIIASDIPANKAVFKDNEILFFQNNNVSDLQEKLLFAINNPEIMIQKSTNAYATILKNHAWKNIAAEYKILMEQLLPRD